MKSVDEVKPIDGVPLTDTSFAKLKTDVFEKSSKSVIKYVVDIRQAEKQIDQIDNTDKSMISVDERHLKTNTKVDMGILAVYLGGWVG